MKNLMLKILVVCTLISYSSIWAQPSLHDGERLDNARKELDGYKSKMPELMELCEKKVAAVKAEFNDQSDSLKAKYDIDTNIIKEKRKQAGVSGFSGLLVSGDKAKIKAVLDNEQKQVDNAYKGDRKRLDESLKIRLDDIDADKARIRLRLVELEDEFETAAKLQKEFEKQKIADAKELAKQKAADEKRQIELDRQKSAEAEKLEKQKEAEAKELERKKLKEMEMAPYKEAENALEQSLNEIDQSESNYNNGYKAEIGRLKSEYNDGITAIKNSYSEKRTELLARKKEFDTQKDIDKAEAVKTELASLQIAYELQIGASESQYKENINKLERDFKMSQEQFRSARGQAKSGYKNRIQAIEDERNLVKQQAEAQKIMERELAELERKNIEEQRAIERQKAELENKRIELAIAVLSQQHKGEIESLNENYKAEHQKALENKNNELSSLVKSEKLLNEDHKAKLSEIEKKFAEQRKNDTVLLKNKYVLDIKNLEVKYDEQISEKQKVVGNIKEQINFLKNERKTALKNASENDQNIDAKKIKELYDGKIESLNIEIAGIEAEFKQLAVNNKSEVSELKSDLDTNVKLLNGEIDAKRNEDNKIAEVSHKQSIDTLIDKRFIVDEDYTEFVKELESKYKTDLKLIDQRYEYLTLDAAVRTDVTIEESDQKFTVSSIEISGNSKISTDEIFGSMPAVYEFVKNKGDDPKYYDFRDIHKLLKNQADEVDLTLAAIQGLTRYILDRYNQRYAGIFVYVPSDAVKEGQFIDNKLRINVVEGNVSGVDVNYNVYAPDSSTGYKKRPEGKEGVMNRNVLMSWSSVKEGEVMEQKKINDFVNLLNQSPDMFIMPVVSKADDADSLLLEYNIYERNPWHIIAQVDNSGSSERKWNPVLGVVNTNLTGRTDILSAFYQGSLFTHPSEMFDDNYSVFGSYEFPVFTPYLRSQIYTAHSGFDADSQDIDGLFFRGSGDVSGVRLFYNLAQFNGWFFDLAGSVSTETSRLSPSLGISSNVRMNIWGSGLNLHKRDAVIDARYGFDFYHNFSGSDEDEFVKARQDTEPGFDIMLFSLKHYQYLDKDKINRMKLWSRYTLPSDRLVPAKMTTFGGFNSVRGYEEDEIVADGGLNVSLQYEFDLVPYLKKSEEGQKDKSYLNLNKFALAAFTDYGRAEIKDPVPGETKTQNLWSVGLGTLFTVNKYFDGEVYYGMAIRETDDTDAGDGRWNLRFIYRW